MLKERLIKAFKEIGFDEYREIKTSDIVFSQDVFDQCEKNICGNFGKNHACPPKSGTVAERKENILKYENAFIISKIVSIKTRKEMIESLELVAKVNKDLRKVFDDEDVIIMGAGPCTKCKECTAINNESCRFPDKIEYSMEGSGIDVVRMSMNQKMTYNAGEGKIGYFTLVLYND